MHQIDCEGSSGPRNFVDNPEQRSPVIMCRLRYNLRGVDISNPALRKTRKALKKRKFDNENYANEAIKISDLNNLKSVHPIWRGAFQVKDKVLKVNNNVNVYAYLSTAASEEVKNFSKSSLPRVVEVEKVPRSKVWPKTRRSPRTIIASIGLFFFPPSMRPTKVSNELVEKIIESDSVLKATVGIAELLIFPSNLLPENNQLFHEKYYLWGTLKLRKDTSDEGVTIVGEQDGSVCATAIEEGQLQEQHVLNQQDEVQSESPDQETSAVNLFGNQPILGNNPEAEKKAMTTSITGAAILPSSSLCNAKANTPTAGSNSSSFVVHPKEMSLQQEEGEQDGSVCATEEEQLQEQHALDQQDEVQRESPDQETSAVNLVGSQPMLKNNPEAEKDAMTTSMTGGVTLPGSSLSNAKVNTPTAGPNSSSSVVHPEEMNLQQEGEQDGSVCATEEGQLQEQHDLDRQDEVQRESPGQETSAVKFVGSQQIVEFKPEAEKKAMTVSMTGGVTLPGSSLSHAKPNAQSVGSNTSVLHPEEEGFTSSPIILFGVNIAQPPRAQPLTQAMVTANSNTGNPAGTDHQPPREHPEAFYLNGPGVEPEPPQPAGVVASQAVLELFPVQQEQMEMEIDPGVLASQAVLELFPVQQEQMEMEIEIDLELRLAVPSPCNLELQL